MSVVNGDEIAAAVGEMNKTFRLPPVLSLIVNKKGVSIAGQEEGSNTIVHVSRPEALIEYGNDIKVGLPPDQIVRALARRPKTTLSVDGSNLVLKASRYNASVITTTAPDIKIPKELKGVDASPLQDMLKEVGMLLSLTSVVEGKPVQVCVEWKKGKFRASAADNAHAVFITGECETKESHTVRLMAHELNILSSVGGQFELGENTIAAKSDRAFVQFQRTVPSADAVPIDSVQALLGLDVEWYCDVDSEELSASMINLDSVLEPNAPISISQDGDTISVKAASGYGKARIRVPITKGSKKDLKSELVVRADTFGTSLGRHGTPVRISKSGNVLRFETTPIKPKKGEEGKASKWVVTSFASLMA